ncbi:MAG: tRNA (adenosine(37)-N6)-threonylcarbamoyltransferase complex dimerization subunit type 1 TsaB [Magnetococcales bacterium]|nr:tRNA (adenosine(37)-N6)-threonylcarbamoyltransferase complex dimerization subunit type 1 TsaB [Magnetococcales bacterium]
MDTSFPRGGVALLDGERLVLQSPFEGAEGHVSLLPRTLDRLLAEAGWELKRLDRIGVTLGPGSFSGVRIALGVAKGISLACGVPVAGFSTLEVVAGAAPESEWVAAILDARRGEVYAALYEHVHGQASQLRMAPGVWDPAEWVAELARWQARSGEPVGLTGDGLGVYRSLFQPLLAAGRCHLVESAFWPLDVVRLGRMTAGRPADSLGPVAALEPLYVRRADAKEPSGGGSIAS